MSTNSLTACCIRFQIALPPPTLFTSAPYGKAPYGAPGVAAAAGAPYGKTPYGKTPYGKAPPVARHPMARHQPVAEVLEYLHMQVSPISC